MPQTIIYSMLFSVGLILLIGAPILAVFLRVAVSLINRIIGPQQHGIDHALVDMRTSEGTPSDNSNPYAPPKTASIAVEQNSQDAITMPRLWEAFGIVLMAVGVSGVSNLLISNFDPGPLPTLLWLALGTGFGLWVLTYSLMLPTSIRRAALVYLIQFAMALVFFSIILAAAWLV